MFERGPRGPAREETLMGLFALGWRRFVPRTPRFRTPYSPTDGNRSHWDSCGILLEGHLGGLRGGLRGERWPLSPHPAVNQAIYHATLGGFAAQGAVLEDLIQSGVTGATFHQGVPAKSDPPTGSQ